jgi:hypothetical protein
VANLQVSSGGLAMNTSSQHHFDQLPNPQGYSVSTIVGIVLLTAAVIALYLLLERN